VSAHLTDEEQLENLKRWWRENGLQSLLVVVLALGGWFGWQYWQERRQSLAEQASVLYNQMLSIEAETAEGTLTPEQRASLTHLAVTLKDAYGRSQYGRYAALLMAKLAVADNDLEAAARELRWVFERADDPAMKLLARLRLARVESARGQYQQALDLLAVDSPGALAPAYAEVRGDILLRQGSIDAARSAYQTALATLSPEDVGTRAMLELKLGQVPVPAAPNNDGAAGGES